MSMLDRPDNRVAGFVLKGQLAETALTRAMGTRTGGAEVSFHSISQRLSIKDLDAEAVTDAEKMSAVYIAIASFENMVRKLISDRLLEEKGADWWKECVSVKIRDRADKKIKDEERIRWHGSRGLSAIYFTELKDLPSIIQQNWACFEDLLPNVEWVRHIITTIERSRHVIMHSGQLSLDDIERVGMNIRDWMHQVGS